VLTRKDEESQCHEQAESPTLSVASFPVTLFKGLLSASFGWHTMRTPLGKLASRTLAYA